MSIWHGKLTLLAPSLADILRLALLQPGDRLGFAFHRRESNRPSVCRRGKEWGSVEQSHDNAEEAEGDAAAKPVVQPWNVHGMGRKGKGGERHATSLENSCARRCTWQCNPGGQKKRKLGKSRSGFYESVEVTTSREEYCAAIMI